MADNDFSFWQIIYSILSSNPNLQGAILATLIAALRVFYDNKETTLFRVFIEALLCGSLSLCVGSLIEIYGLPESAVITIGGAIGLIGFSALRNKLLKIINRKMDNKDQ